MKEGGKVSKRKTEPVEHDRERMLSPVPLSERRPAWKQVMVWVGFGYVVTGLFVGGVLAGFGGKPGVPPGTSLWAVALGMGFLFVLTSHRRLLFHQERPLHR